jgi:hypothetical protein
LKILKGLEAAVEVVKGILKQYDSDSYRYEIHAAPHCKRRAGENPI